MISRLGNVPNYAYAQRAANQQSAAARTANTVAFGSKKSDDELAKREDRNMMAGAKFLLALAAVGLACVAGKAGKDYYVDQTQVKPIEHFMENLEKVANLSTDCENQGFKITDKDGTERNVSFVEALSKLSPKAFDPSYNGLEASMRKDIVDAMKKCEE